MLSKIYLEITNVCNLNCTFCHKTSRKKRFITSSLLVQEEQSAPSSAATWFDIVHFWTCIQSTRFFATFTLWNDITSWPISSILVNKWENFITRNCKEKRKEKKWEIFITSSPIPCRTNNLPNAGQWGKFHHFITRNCYVSEGKQLSSTNQASLIKTNPAQVSEKKKIVCSKGEFSDSPVFFFQNKP